MKNQLIKIVVFGFLTSMCCSVSLFAQRNLPEDGLATLDENLFIGGLSPNILQNGQAEINFYNALFSNWVAVHESVVESRVVDRFRVSDFTTNVEGYYGISNNGRFDVGLRLKYARRRVDNAARSSPFEVFSKSDEEAENVGIDRTYTGVREVGFRLRFLPFVKIKNLTINAGYSLSPVKSETIQQYLGADMNRFDINAAYYVALNKSGNSYYYFSLNGVAAIPPIGKLDDINPFNDKMRYEAGGSFFIIQRMGPFMLFPGLSYNLSFKQPDLANSDKSLIRTNEQVLGLLGLQFTPSNNFSLNITGALPFILKNSNKLTQTVPESFSFLSFGGRIAFK